MKYLGLIVAIVVMVCVFTYVTRLSSIGSPTTDLGNSNSYASTINSVRETVRSATSAEQRRKWAVQLQMKESGIPDAMTFSAEGENAEVLVVRADSMDFGSCSTFAKSDNGIAAAGVGFTSVSCRTQANGIILEMPLN